MQMRNKLFIYISIYIAKDLTANGFPPSFAEHSRALGVI